MPYKDYQELEKLVISKNPIYEKHSEEGSDLKNVKEKLNNKVSRSSDLFSSWGGILACRKNGNIFEFKCGNGNTGIYDSISNRFDFSKEINITDETWYLEE